VADSSNGRANASPVPRKKRRRSKAEIVCPIAEQAVDSIVLEDFGSMINSICDFCVVFVVKEYCVLKYVASLILF
jgi:hypothetical protein